MNIWTDDIFQLLFNYNDVKPGEVIVYSKAVLCHLYVWTSSYNSLYLLKQIPFLHRALLLAARVPAQKYP